jgi:hypothetical protein
MNNTETTTAPVPPSNVSGLAEGLGSLFAGALNLEMIAIIVGSILTLIFLAVIVARVGGFARHPQVRNLSKWVTDPQTDALAIAIDVDTKEMRILPLKRVGEFYVWGNRFVVPVDGGEQYMFLGKPTFIAILHGRYGVKWIPAQSQGASLSLKPVDSGDGADNPQEVMERLINEIVSGKALLTGSVTIAPNQSLYISVKPASVIDNLMRTIAFGVDALTAVIQTAIKSVEREGTSVFEATARYVETKSRSIVFIALGLAIAIGVLLFFMKQAGVI